MAAVEARCISAEKPLHPGNQVRLRRLNHEMKMVRHETERMHLPACLDTRISQCLEKRFAIRIVNKDVIAAVAAAHDMIDRAGELNA